MSEQVQDHDGHDEGRRDFLYITTGAFAAAIGAAAIWPFIDAWNPSADVLALASTEADLSAIEVGQSVTVVWRGKPVFIRHRTEEEIALANLLPEDLPDPQSDGERVLKPEWLVVVGICTHLGCVPLGQKTDDNRGEYDGWFCPCHGSHYDTSGRIRKGPAPRNLDVPEYAFLTDSSIRVG